MTYQYKCECGEETEIDKAMALCSRRESCPDCGKKMSRVWSAPVISFNHWVPDPRQMDGEKEFIAAGGYE